MRTSQIVIAALFASVQAVKLNQQWAVGMNGDEDLGQDITMKGQKFHYSQGDFAEGDNDRDQGKTITVKGQSISYAQGVCDGANGSNM